MSVVGDLGLVLVATVAAGSAWYGVALYLADVRARRAGLPASPHVERDVTPGLRDHSVTPA